MKPVASRIFLRVLLLIGATLSFGLSAQAALTWNTRRVDQTAKPGDREAIGLFPFVNAGTTMVTITAVQPSCGCTTAELEKRTYAPGESGVIKAIFTLGDRVGEQEKTIYVTTDEPSVRPVPLILHVVIPELLLYTPRLLLWKTGDKLEEKASTITTNTKLSIASLKIVSAAAAEVTVRIVPVDSGNRYQLFVRPAANDKVMNETITVAATFADGTMQTFSIYALVR